MNLSVSTLLAMLSDTGYRVTHRENNITGVKTFIIIFNPYRELMFHIVYNYPHFENFDPP